MANSSDTNLMGDAFNSPTKPESDWALDTDGNKLASENL
jgi:hypothetical protein